MLPVYYREALTFIREQPLRWLSLLPRKFFYLWVPVGPSYSLHSRLYRYSSAGAYLILLPFGLLGFVRLVRARVPASALWLLTGSVVLTCLVFFPQDRYRVPAIDPVLIICAASLASRTGDRQLRNSSAVR